MLVQLRPLRLTGRRFLLELAVFGASFYSGAFGARAVSQVELGVLTCDGLACIDTAKEISLVCDFHAVDGPPEAYSAIIKKHNLTAGTAGHLVWTVTARKLPDHSGSLAGDYARTANALVGGGNNAFVLQPVSAADGSDDNLAPAVSRMTIIASN